MVTILNHTLTFVSAICIHIYALCLPIFWWELVKYSICPNGVQTFEHGNQYKESKENLIMFQF